MSGKGCCAKNELGVRCKNRASGAKNADGMCPGTAHRFEGLTYTQTRKRELDAALQAEPGFGVCPGDAHVRVSPYARVRVPLESFRKDWNDPKSALCKTCLDCRQNGHSRHEDAKKQKLERKAEPGFGVCRGGDHVGVSPYPRERVPAESFRKDQADPDSALCIDCLDCRLHKRVMNKIFQARGVQKATEAAMSACIGCSKTFPADAFAKNKDGNYSARCPKCKLAIDRTNDKTSTILRKLKMERIGQQKSCCYDCHSFFVPNETDTSVIEIHQHPVTLLYAFEGMEYEAQAFIEKFQNRLETRILECDHLPPEEQLARGMIYKLEDAAKKISEIHQLKTEHKMRREFKTCDLLCGKCHLIRTLSRRGGAKSSSVSTIEKFAYTNARKREAGCTCCGLRLEGEMLQFLEFDHIDPETKIDSIGAMCKSAKYSLADVKKEDTEKCRILCKYCHRLNTFRQQQAGKVR